MVVFKSKIKWITLLVLFLSFASLLRYFSIARFSTADLVQYTAMAAFRDDLVSFSVPGLQVCNLYIYDYMCLCVYVYD